jgi:serine protease Do
MRTLPLVLAAALGGASVLCLAPSAPVAGAAPEAVPAGPPDFADVCARTAPGVVGVLNYLERPRDVPDPGDASNRNENVGSGFVWTADGWIVTNYHVTSGARTTLVEIAGRGWVEAQVRGADKTVDVALLKVDVQGRPLTPLPIGDPRALRVGQWVLAAGTPNRLPRSFSVGIVSGLERSDTGANPSGYEDFIQSDAAINLGGSGGPLLDAAGRVVGLNTAILSRTGGFQGVSLSVPIDVVLETARMLRAGGEAVRPTIGVRVRAADPLLSMRLPGGAGLVVTDFMDESSAKRAGIQRGDAILSIDGVPTPTRGSLQHTVWSRLRGTTVTLRVARGAQVLDIAVRLD